MTEQWESFEKVVGHRLRQAREHAGLKSSEAGAALSQVLGAEWSRQQINDAELGKRALRVIEVVAFAYAYDVPLPSLLSPLGLAEEVVVPSGRTLEIPDFVRLGVGDPGSSSATALAAIASRLRVTAEKLSNDQQRLVDFAEELEATLAATEDIPAVELMERAIRFAEGFDKTREGRDR